MTPTPRRQRVQVLCVEYDLDPENPHSDEVDVYWWEVRADEDASTSLPAGVERTRPQAVIPNR